MSLNYVSILILLTVAIPISGSMEHLIFKRESAFDLLRLESEFEAMIKDRQRLNARSIGLIRLLFRVNSFDALFSGE
jgi:hypothetical protein